MAVTHGSLFSGIGGFDLAATWMGWNNIFSCEKDRFCRNVLQYYWPNTKHYEDIYEFDATVYRGCIDVISGGFPCQPFSQAGQRKGKNDDRYLWPQTRRIITEVRPEWIVLENVAGLFTILEPESLSSVEIKAIELFCQDGEQAANSTILRLQRRVIGTIIEEIGSAGYLLPRLEDGTPIILCIPACAVNAPHRRDRTWFVAYADSLTDRQSETQRSGTDGRATAAKRRQSSSGHPEGCPVDADAPAPAGSKCNCRGRYGCHSKDEIQSGERGQYAQHDLHAHDLIASHARSKGLERNDREQDGHTSWQNCTPHWNEWPTQPPVCGRNDGISRAMDGITFRKWREESVKAFGNAIVPQVALELFRAIQQAGFKGRRP
jgi:DNA (cytosine-5)-methyltransferase 1